VRGGGGWDSSKVSKKIESQGEQKKNEKDEQRRITIGTFGGSRSHGLKNKGLHPRSRESQSKKEGGGN